MAREDYVLLGVVGHHSNQIIFLYFLHNPNFCIIQICKYGFFLGKGSRKGMQVEERAERRKAAL